MTSPRDQTRRNRNIGTAAQGHGQNNHLTIPDPYVASGAYWSRVGVYTFHTRPLGEREFPIIEEATRPGCAHACSVDDILTILRLLPDAHSALLAGVFLRQPKRKEQILAPVWGRIAYGASIGRPQTGMLRGPIIILEATRPDSVWRHPKSLSPDAAMELERLAQDGHILTTMRSHIRVQSSQNAIRATQLYRTIPHEIGHLVDYTTRVPDDSNRWLELEEAYWRRPSQERESFAHRYADEFHSRLFLNGALPLPRLP